MVNHNFKTMFVFILLSFLLLACGPAEPSPLCTNGEYHQIAVTAINDAAATYVVYARGQMSFNNAMDQGQGIAKEIRDLNCEGDEHIIVNNILKASWYAIEAEEKSGFSIANIYIEKAFKGINVLQTYYGWRI